MYFDFIIYIDKFQYVLTKIFMSVIVLYTHVIITLSPPQHSLNIVESGVKHHKLNHHYPITTVS